MEADFKGGNFEAGVIKNVAAMSREFAKIFHRARLRPRRTAGRAGGDFASWWPEQI
jgi:hypothetical protein